MWRIGKILNGIGFWLFRKIVGYEEFKDRMKLTPCQNCKNGYIEAPIKEFSPDFLVSRTCWCCGGEYEDCRNCGREFPNSLEAVMDGNG